MALRLDLLGGIMLFLCMGGTTTAARFGLSVHFPFLALLVIAEVAGGAAPAVVGDVGVADALAGAGEDGAADEDDAALLELDPDPEDGLEELPEMKAATAGPGKVYEVKSV